MRISGANFGALVDRIREESVGSHIRRVTFFSSRLFYFELSRGKRRFLIVDLDNSEPSLFVANLDITPATLASPLYLFLKKELGNAYIKDIVQIEGDRIARFDLEVSTPTYKRLARHLYLELIPAHPNLIFTDEEDIILAAFRKSPLDSPRVIARGFAYHVPEKKASDKEEAIVFDYDKYVQCRLGKLSLSAISRNQEKFVRIYKFINARIRSSSHKIDNIQSDVESAQKMLVYKEYAEALQGLPYDKRWHTDKIAIGGMEIILDQTKTLADNIQIFYRKYKKAKSTIALSDKLIEDAEKELNDSLFVKDFLSTSSEEEIERFVARNAAMKKGDRIRLPVVRKYAPYSLEKDGTRFYYGKSADQNDYLSFVYASRQHTWFHVVDHAGAHVIVKKLNPSDEDLLTAAEIALLCSDLDRGDVMYALRRDISRGTSKGEAIVRAHKTIYLSFIRPETIALFASAKRLEVK